MNQADKEFLASLRVRARNGEEFNPNLLALYRDLVARDARKSGKHTIFLIFIFWFDVDDSTDDLFFSYGSFSGIFWLLHSMWPGSDKTNQIFTFDSDFSGVNSFDFNFFADPVNFRQHFSAVF